MAPESKFNKIQDGVKCYGIYCLVSCSERKWLRRGSALLTCFNSSIVNFWFFVNSDPAWINLSPAGPKNKTVKKHEIKDQITNC